MSTATCTPDVQRPSVAENEVIGEPSSVRSRVEGAGDGAEQPGRSRGSARQDEQAAPRTSARKEEQAAPSASAANRDAKGRFGPGNLGGPGNPFARELARFRAFVIKCNTEEHMRFAFNKMMEMIGDGNVGALKLYFLYIIGKPTDAVDPDKLDLDEIEGYKATANMLDEASALMKAPATDLPLSMLRIGKAAVTQTMRDFVVHNLEHTEEMAKAKEEALRKKKEENERIRKLLDTPASDVFPHLVGVPGFGVPFVPAPVPPAPVSRQQTADNGHARPSPNGGNGHASPSANGSNGHADSRLGADVPSANGSDGGLSPLANGGNGHAEPSANGSDGGVSPSANGDNGAAAEEAALAAELEALVDRLARGRSAA